MRPVLFAAAVALGSSVSARAQESPVTLDTKTGTLHGTLLVPAGTRVPVPVALIIAGSGPTDRDGNSPMLPGKNNSLKLLAEALATHGIASVRYDKRGPHDRRRGKPNADDGIGAEPFRFVHHAVDRLLA